METRHLENEEKQQKTTKEQLGKKIRTLRSSKNLTQKQLADSIKVTKNIVGLWERGDRSPKENNLIKIAKFFKVEISYFDTEDDKALKQESEGSVIAEPIAKYSKPKQTDTDIIKMLVETNLLTLKGSPIPNNMIKEIFDSWHQVNNEFESMGERIALLEDIGKEQSEINNIISA